MEQFIILQYIELITVNKMNDFYAERNKILQEYYTERKLRLDNIMRYKTHNIRMKTLKELQDE